MPSRWSEAHRGYHGRQHEDSPRAHGASRGPSLYEVVLRQAIVTQHGLIPSDRLELRACEGCGKPYLLTSVWLPHSLEPYSTVVMEKPKLRIRAEVPDELKPELNYQI